MIFKINNKIILIVILIIGSIGHSAKAQDIVDATTMTNKVMAGYQGWFRTPGDRSGNQSWAHLFNGPPVPQKLAFDTWPDMSELTPSEKYAVPGFSYADGSQAYLYSAQNYKTVLRHFEWMKQYGIDGVWLSEFCGHFPGAKGERDAPNVERIMDNVRKAARATGRTWAFMWDMSGFGPSTSKEDVYNIMINQWKKMVDDGITSDNRYMHHNGKPVLLIWGFFPNRPASQPDYMNPVLDFLLTSGKYEATLVGGVDPNWRAQGTPAFQAMLMRMQGLQPWSVGRRIKDSTTGIQTQNTSNWEGDIEKCNANHVLFMPVFNSGTHVAGPPPTPPAGPTVPRRMGNYLWEQFVRASQIGGISSVFVAMFDEINEGTQILKIDIHPPVNAPFLTYDGATSDYYLRLVGVGARLLKEGKPIAHTIPISPFDPGHWYQFRNRATHQLLSIAEQGLIQTRESDKPDDKQLWQIIYDNAGYYTLKNKSTGQYISLNNKTIGMHIQNDATAKFQMEWDGTDGCHLVSKGTQTGIGLDDNGGITGKPDAARDELRWQIIPQ